MSEGMRSVLAAYKQALPLRPPSLLSDHDVLHVLYHISFVAALFSSSFFLPNSSRVAHLHVQAFK